MTREEATAKIRLIQSLIVSKHKEDREYVIAMQMGIKAMEFESQIIRCKDCKYFEIKDWWKNVDGHVILFADQCPTCTKWSNGDGCMTKEDGYCFLAERKEENA